MEKFEDRESDEIVDFFENVHRIHRYEGESGVRNLRTLVQSLNFEYRDVEDFLVDNPGACEAIVQWIREWIDRVPEWKESMIQDLRDSGKFCSDCDQLETEASPECINPAHQAGSILDEILMKEQGGTNAE